MTAIREWWERSPRGARIAGACGVAAAVAAAWLYGVAVPQGRADIQKLREAAQATAARASAPAAPEAPAARRIEAFHEHFPSADTLEDWIERIDAAGVASGVSVERTDYRLAGGAAAGLQRYHIMLPVKGTYQQLRTLIGALLQSVPTLALSNLDFRRDAIGTAMLEGRLEFVLFLKARER